MSDFHAFANDDQVFNIEGDALTVTNGTTRVVVSGTLDIAHDKRGLKTALALKAAVDAIVAALQKEAHDLPDALDDEPPAPGGTIDNPFT